MQDHIFEGHCSAYKHLQNNVEVSPLYRTDILPDTGNYVKGEFSNDKDNTQQSQTTTITKAMAMIMVILL